LIVSRDKIEYVVRDPDDWAGLAYFLTSRSEAYDFWSEHQGWHAYEVCVEEGSIRDLTDDFAEAYVEECRDARLQARHERSFAPDRRTHL
jgi:hypothetical protein